MTFFKKRVTPQQWSVEAKLKRADLKVIITAPTVRSAVTKFLITYPGAEVLSVRQYKEYYHY